MTEHRTEPTVAELRADIARRVADMPARNVQASMLRSIVEFLDDYLASTYQPGRTYSSVEISRMVKDRGLKPADRAAEEMLAELIRHERDVAARRAASGDTNPYDLDPYTEAHDLAEQYEQARANGPADLDRFLDDLAATLDLADVKALRTTAAAVAEAMGRIALDARKRGMSSDRIASETGYTASRIAQFLREERERRGEAK
ncbi:hypothetical protein ACFWDF_02955 [Streptomyces diastaticus]|uniref:hypothetical protein n=1 Tax=Streptomyces diastaticus TaxID=1956 RepID=UPI00368ABE39